MDFGRLVGGQDPNLTRQLAEQLLSNTLFRDAAIKATQKDDNTGDATQSQTENTEASSGLDNLLNQLTSALTQAQAAPESADNSNADSGASVQAIFSHPLVQQALASVPTELALGVKVALGQIPPEQAQQALDLLNSIPAATVDKVKAVLGNLDQDTLEKGINFFQALFGQRGDRVFAQQNNSDVYLNSTNTAQVTGADLDKFLQTAYYTLTAGYDVGKFLDHATKVLNQGDYDDFRRFLSVTDMVLYKGDDLETFFNFGDKMLDDSHHDFEGNLFQIYTTLAYGGTVQNYVDIASGLNVTEQEGRNNLVDLTRITVDAYKKGANMPTVFNALATEAKRDGGDVRAMMDQYMTEQGMPPTGPDYSKFDRIERIDGDTMYVKQGESAALFAQAVSSREGLLPESVLYWSSDETGALSHGSSYLDLSKLPPGTYHIGVKIGNYAGGTDTAFKTVVIEPNPDYVPPEENPEIIVPEDSQVKVTVEAGSAALRSDLYMKQNGGTPETVAENAQDGAGTILQKIFKAGDKLDFFTRTYNPSGTYDHGTDIGETTDGRKYCKVEKLSDTSWRISFEDMEGSQSDMDYNDVVVTVELMKIAQDSTQGQQDTHTELGEIAAGGGTTTPTEPPVVAMGKDEAVQTTRDALSALDSGSSPDEVASMLNKRYYLALDEQVADNMDYAQKVDEARSDPGSMKAVLQDILKSLTGEDPTPPPAEEQPPAQVNYNPYF